MGDPIEFTEEQSMLLDTAQEFCQKHSPMEVVRSRLDTEDIDAATWREMTDLGWLGINVPEEFGGLGMGISSVVPIVESMGRYLMGSPLTGTVVACEALVSSASKEQNTEWLPRIVGGAIATVALTEADGSWLLGEVSSSAAKIESGYQLSGAKCFVTDADAAEIIVVSVMLDGNARLVMLERQQIPDGALIRETVIDQTRRSFELKLDGIVIEQSQVLPSGDFKAIELAAMLMLCAEMSGGLVSVTHLIVEYLNTRKAFDRLIGSYQALKHPTVDILLSLEAMRSHLYHAATLVGRDDANAEAAIRMAKAHGSESYSFAGDRAVQFHGGFGFTFECDAQLYLRRALWCQHQFGDERYQRKLLEPLLFGPLLSEQEPLDTVA